MGKYTIGFNMVHGGYSFEDINEEGDSIWEFIMIHDLIVVNSLKKGLSIDNF